MNLLLTPLASNGDIMRNLGYTILSGSKDLISCQIDSTDAFVTRSSQLLKATLSGLAIAQEPERLPEAIQSIMQNTLEMTRDTLVATTDYQIETMRLLQKHGAESQKLFAESLEHQFHKLETAMPSEQHPVQKRRQAA